LAFLSGLEYHNSDFKQFDGMICLFVCKFGENQSSNTEDYDGGRRTPPRLKVIFRQIISESTW